MTDLDQRIANLRERRQMTVSIAGQEIERLRGEVAALDRAVQQADERIRYHRSGSDQLATDLDRLAVRLVNLRRLVVVGIVAVVVTAIAILCVAVWSGAIIRQAAAEEAANIRMQNAAEIAQAQQEGEEALTDLRQQIADQRASIEDQIDEVGGDLAMLAEERDAAREELEQFSRLRDRIGFELIEYRGSAVIIVPEGQEVSGWRAPGLSNLARYNGRIFRVRDAD